MNIHRMLPTSKTDQWTKIFLNVSLICQALSVYKLLHKAHIFLTQRLFLNLEYGHPMLANSLFLPLKIYPLRVVVFIYENKKKFCLSCYHILQYLKPNVL